MITKFISAEVFVDIQKERRENNLSAENIHSKPIEAADHGLLNVQTKTIQSPHSRKQETWSATTEHVDVDSSSLP